MVALIEPDTISWERTDKLWERVRRPNCERCPLHEGATTVCLLGDGPTPSPYMAIGEAPGEREDEEFHKPFTGSAGKLLDETLEDNGLSREMFYITNAAKCRPPGNRKPKKAEIDACNVFLRAELRVHKPKYVLLLGDSALQATLGIKGLMANRQRVVKRDGISYFVALHPAAGLHRPAYKQLFQDDIAAFARLVRGEDKQQGTKVVLVNNEARFKKFLKLLRNAPTVAFDVETIRRVHPTQTEPAGTITIFGAGFETGKSYVVPLDHAEGWAPKRWNINAARIAYALWGKPGVPFRPSFKRKIIAHNGKYDLEWFLKYTPHAEYTFDTMFAAFLLDENRSMSLENLSLQELRVKPWKSDVQYKRDFPLKKYALYNAKDVDYTMRLYKLYAAQLTRETRLRKVFQYILMPTANIFARIEDRGIYIPEERLQERIKEALLEEKKVLAELMTYVPENMRMVQVGKKLKPFNPGSSPQMARLLYGEDGLNLPFPAEAHPKFRMANKGLGSTAEGPMLLLKHPITKVIERWRYLKTKVLATYFLRWKAIRDLNGYAHFGYNLIGAVTGRISSDLHQVPRDPFVRGVLSVEDDEWMWGAADLSQAEMRVAAHLSKDPTLRRIFINGEDVHLNTAMEVTGLSAKKITGELRKRAKAINFGFLYRMYERKFQAQAREKFEIELTLDEARTYRRGFFKAYGKLEAWHERAIYEAKMNGYVTYLDGRKRRLPEIWSESEATRSEAERQAINSPVQGVISDLALLSMVIAEKGWFGFTKIVDENFQWMGQMHDEVIFRVRKGYENEKARALKHLMENLPLKKLFGFEFNVPIVAEVKLGKFWGEAKEWKDAA